ncbi:MAG: hypothetical protein OEY99_02380 [Aigarchaeota archaeon]|nr:hypothetical protein [Aigarchaeota archaeon]
MSQRSRSIDRPRRETPNVFEGLPDVLKFETGDEEIRIMPENDTIAITDLRKQGFTLWNRFAGRVILKRPTTGRSIETLNSPDTSQG